MPSVRRVYWDACVFLSYINGVENRRSQIEALLEGAKNGDFEIITSTVSLAEVAFSASEKEGMALDSTVERQIAGMWGPPLKLVEFSPPIGVRAAALVRAAMVRGMGLRPMDAIHLSTAEQMAAASFHTYDEALQKFAPLVGFPIRQPDPISVQPDLFEGTDAKKET
jgi:predicted nucleic acid-binding protein